MNGTPDTSGSLFAKIIGLWGLIGVTSWSEAASFAAFCFTMYLLFRHIWRDIARPFLESVGWMKPCNRVQVSVTDDEVERVNDSYR